MYKLLLLAAVAFILGGCTAAQRLEDNAEAALEMAVNPEQRELHYLREGNTSHYYRRECSGKFCEKK